VEVESSQKQFVSHGMMPLWSPDGCRLAFNSSEPDGRPLGVSVWDGKGVRLIARTERSPTHFTWTSDSRQVIVDYLHATTPTGQRLWLVPISVADGQQGEPIGSGTILAGWPRSHPSPKGVCLGLWGQRYVWTPNVPGNQTSIDSWIKGAKDLTAHAKIERAAAKSLVGELEAAGREYQAGDNEAAAKHFRAWSEGVERHRRASALTDGQASALLNAADWSPSSVPIGWTGDGRVVFIAQTPPEPPTWVPVKELVVEPAGGGTPTVVCELPGKPDGIDWSPDLSRLAIALDECGVRETTDAKGRRTARWQNRFALRIVDLASKAETDLGAGQYPHWSPDGRRLLYAEPQSGPEPDSPLQNLYVVDEQGGNKRVVAQGCVSGPESAAWSPDSRLVGYSVFPRSDMYGRSVAPGASTDVGTPPTPASAGPVTQATPSRPTGLPPTLANFKGWGNATTDEFEAETHWTIIWKRPSSSDEKPIHIRWMRKGRGPKARGEVVTVQTLPLGDMKAGRSRVVRETGRLRLEVKTSGEWEIMVRAVQ
jgi:dipeptidyl aminopeptidase/acylaminoacyl peptidase